MLTTQHWVLNTEYPRLHTQYYILNTQHSVLDTEYWLLNRQYSILHTERWLLNTQYRILKQYWDTSLGWLKSSFSHPASLRSLFPGSPDPEMVWLCIRIFEKLNNVKACLRSSSFRDWNRSQKCSGFLEIRIQSNHCPAERSPLSRKRPEPETLIYPWEKRYTEHRRQDIGHRTQHTRYNTQNTENKTQDHWFQHTTETRHERDTRHSRSDTRHKTRHVRDQTRDTKHKRRDTRHETEDTRTETWNIRHARHT